MNLSFLSINRFSLSLFGSFRPTQPHVPTNAERLQALRYALTPVVGNSHPWPYLQAPRNEP